MNDKTSCFVSILDMVSIDVIGSSIAILQAPSDVDYESLHCCDRRRPADPAECSA